MSKTWVILDCNYLCHRAKYSTGHLSYDGDATGVVYGFLWEVLDLRKRYEPCEMVFCWDSRHSERKKIEPSYKSNRKLPDLTPEQLQFEKDFRKQVLKLRKVYLKQLGFKNILHQKGYESDDHIAMAARILSKKSEVIIVTSDQDLYQCLRPNVLIFNPQTKKEITIQTFYTDYGILPDQWGLVKCLAGCPSDNVKGVPGIGEKTAIKYIKAELKPHTKAYQKLNCEKAVEITLHNTILVKLPMKGTKKRKLHKDKLSKKEWKILCKKLGMKSLEKAFL